MCKHKVDFLAVAFCLQLNFVSVFKVFATQKKGEKEGERREIEVKRGRKRERNVGRTSRLSRLIKLLRGNI